LTPVYPANPGKDLPIKDTPVIQPAKPAATTTGSASIAPPAATPAPAPVANAPTTALPAQAGAAPQVNSCNVEACAATYRSFRESDCSYQPLVGARRTCEGAPGLGGPSSTGQAAATPPQSPPPPPQQARRQFDPRSVPTISRDRYDDSLRDAERTVRRLPPPPGRFDVDDDTRGVIVLESPEQRYDLRRNWVSEPGD
jgi:hypothetical protein